MKMLSYTDPDQVYEVPCVRGQGIFGIKSIYDA